LQNECYLSIPIFKLCNIHGLKLLNIIFKYVEYWYCLILTYYLFGGIGKNTQVENPKDWDKVIKSWKDGEISAVEAMNRMNMNRGTFYRRVKEIGIL